MKLLLAILATALLLGSEGRRTSQVPPEVLYRQIEARFVSGDLAGAARESQSTQLGDASSPLWRARFRLQQARIRIYQGSPEALTLLTPPLPGDLPDSSLERTRTSLLTIAYRRAGDLTRAEQTLAQARALCRNEPGCADVRLSQGIVDLDKDDLEDAQHSFELCLASAEQSGDNFQQTQALINLGVVAERQEHYEDALSRLRQASIVAKAMGGRLLLEKTTGGIGWAFYMLGDYRRALENSKLAEGQAAALGISIDEVQWLDNAGLSEFRLGDLKAARSSYERSYALARSLRNDEKIANALVALAYLSLESGDTAGAMVTASQALSIANRRGDADEALQPSLIKALALAKGGETVAARLDLLALEHQRPIYQSDRWEIEHALARLDSDEGKRASADHWYRRAIATFIEQRASLSDVESRLPFFENGSSLYLDYMEHLIRQGDTEAALKVLDQSRAETLAEGLEAGSGTATGAAKPEILRVKAARSLGAAALQPNAIARRLGGTILVYCLRPQTSYLWAIAPDRTAFFRLPGKAAVLALVGSHTRAILASRDLLNVQAFAGAEGSPGQALYHLLVEPAASLIAPGGRVFIVADQGLNGLNFETLLTAGAQPHFWIEDANIVDARSLSLLAAGHRDADRPALPGTVSGTASGGTAQGRLLLVGDPVYHRPEYPALPHAEEEIANVADHFPAGSRVVLTGAQATPAAYQHSQPGSFAYIHFVAHASASELNPLDASVILSSPPASPESYKLYARTILEQPLAAELVTISGCYGSGVRAYAGEGLVGLAWAFLRAGSHNVVGALWEASDNSTPKLMQDLYDGLSRGDSPSTALRAAKLAMIHRGGVFRKAFYWAPFQLYSGS